MNRVWKKFLLNISKGLSMVLYVGVTIFLSGMLALHLGYDPGMGMAVGALVFLVLPILAMILRQEYKDAKLEVERENREMLRMIKDPKF
jgi:hypothetical protein